jgi:hypothetical protein
MSQGRKSPSAVLKLDDFHDLSRAEGPGATVVKIVQYGEPIFH